MVSVGGKSLRCPQQCRNIRPEVLSATAIALHTQGGITPCHEKAAAGSRDREGGPRAPAPGIIQAVVLLPKFRPHPTLSPTATGKPRTTGQVKGQGRRARSTWQSSNGLPAVTKTALQRVYRPSWEGHAHLARSMRSSCCGPCCLPRTSCTPLLLAARLPPASLRGAARPLPAAPSSGSAAATSAPAPAPAASCTLVPATAAALLACAAAPAPAACATVPACALTAAAAGTSAHSSRAAARPQGSGTSSLLPPEAPACSSSLTNGSPPHRAARWMGSLPSLSRASNRIACNSFCGRPCRD